MLMPSCNLQAILLTRDSFQADWMKATESKIMPRLWVNPRGTNTMEFLLSDCDCYLLSQGDSCHTSINSTSIHIILGTSPISKSKLKWSCKVTNNAKSFMTSFSREDTLPHQHDIIGNIAVTILLEAVLVGLHLWKNQEGKTVIQVTDSFFSQVMIRNYRFLAKDLEWKKQLEEASNRRSALGGSQW